jgi:hypothetical protein
MSEISDIRERISALKLELQDYSQRIVSHVEILHAPNISKTPVDFKNDPRNAVSLIFIFIFFILMIVLILSSRA